MARNADLPMSRMDFTPAEISATGHLVSSCKSAEISRAGEERFSMRFKRPNEQFTILTRTVNTSQAKNVRGLSAIYAS
jgi:hypothetical protein